LLCRLSYVGSVRSFEDLCIVYWAIRRSCTGFQQRCQCLIQRDQPPFISFCVAGFQPNVACFQVYVTPVQRTNSRLAPAGKERYRQHGFEPAADNLGQAIKLFSREYSSSFIVFPLQDYWGIRSLGRYTGVEYNLLLAGAIDHAFEADQFPSPAPGNGELSPILLGPNERWRNGS
jgi:hypothetical protein